MYRQEPDAPRNPPRSVGVGEGLEATVYARCPPRGREATAPPSYCAQILPLDFCGGAAPFSVKEEEPFNFVGQLVYNTLEDDAFTRGIDSPHPSPASVN